MDTLEIALLVTATVVVFGGMGVIVYRELASPKRRLVSRGRDLVEVLLPMAGVVVLVTAVWFIAAD